MEHKMRIAWENDRPVVVSRDMRSSWPDAPNQERFRQEWLYPVLRTGQADSAMKHYLETMSLDRLTKRRDRAARLAALTRN